MTVGQSLPPGKPPPSSSRSPVPPSSLVTGTYLSYSASVPTARRCLQCVAYNTGTKRKSVRTSGVRSRGSNPFVSRTSAIPIYTFNAPLSFRSVTNSFMYSSTSGLSCRNCSTFCWLSNTRWRLGSSSALLCGLDANERVLRASRVRDGRCDCDWGECASESA